MQLPTPAPPQQPGHLRADLLLEGLALEVERKHCWDLSMSKAEPRYSSPHKGTLSSSRRSPVSALGGHPGSGCLTGSRPGP